MAPLSAPRSAFLVACWLAPASTSLLSAPCAHTCGVARARGAAACADADAFLGAHVLMDYEGVVFDDASEGGSWCLAALGDAVADAGQGRIILGDLNAELPDALGREGRQPKLADELLRELCEEEQFITAGPDQATYTHTGAERVSGIIVR